jgi:hypothetical protein
VAHETCAWHFFTDKGMSAITHSIRTSAAQTPDPLPSRKLPIPFIISRRSKTSPRYLRFGVCAFKPHPNLPIITSGQALSQGEGLDHSGFSSFRQTCLPIGRLIRAIRVIGLTPTSRLLHRDRLSPKGEGLKCSFFLQQHFSALAYEILR